jgi:transposase
MEASPMKNRSDLNQSYAAFDQTSTLGCVVELSSKSWLAAGTVPGVKRQPKKKLSIDPFELLAQIGRWRAEAEKAGPAIKRIVVAFEAGRDGFWLAQWLEERGIEVYVIHAASIPVSREHKRPKSDRLDTEMLMRALLGWLRGEPRHCRMVQSPTLEQEDAKRPSREHKSLVTARTSLVNQLKSILAWLGITNFSITGYKAGQKLAALRTQNGEPIPPNTLDELYRGLERLALIKKQIKAIEDARMKRLKATPDHGTNPLVRMLAQILGLGLETADLLVHEVLTRNLRDHRAVGRYAGLTGSPDESGKTRREQGLAKAGNWRVRHASLELAWRWLKWQKGSALAQWYRQRTAGGEAIVRKKMIVALARKLLIALWRCVTTGELPAGVVLKPAAI